MYKRLPTIGSVLHILLIRGRLHSSRAAPALSDKLDLAFATLIWLAPHNTFRGHIFVTPLFGYAIAIIPPVSRQTKATHPSLEWPMAMWPGFVPANRNWLARGFRHGRRVLSLLYWNNAHAPETTWSKIARVHNTIFAKFSPSLESFNYFVKDILVLTLHTNLRNKLDWDTLSFSDQSGASTIFSRFSHKWWRRHIFFDTFFAECIFKWIFVRFKETINFSYESNTELTNTSKKPSVLQQDW